MKNCSGQKKIQGNFGDLCKGESVLQIAMNKGYILPVQIQPRTIPYFFKYYDTLSSYHSPKI